MKSIFVVWYGNYPYYPEGFFSTEENAELFIKKSFKYYDTISNSLKSRVVENYRVEEVILDKELEIVNKDLEKLEKQ